MIFHVLKATTGFSQFHGGKSNKHLSFELTPEGHDYIEIGEGSILCSRSYHPILRPERRLVTARVSISDDRGYIEHIGSEGPICGYANFSPEHNVGANTYPPHLSMYLAVSPDQFQEMLRLAIPAAGTARLQLGIEGLDFGSAPDGSHQIWKLDDERDCGSGQRRRIADFWFNVDTFWTSEGAIRAEEDARLNTWVAESPNRDERNAADPPKPDPDAQSAEILRHCRMALYVLVVLGFFLAIKMSSA